MEGFLLSPKELGALARQRRESLQRSQKDIARALSVSQTTLHKLETGIVDESKHWPRLFTLLGLPLAKIDPIYEIEAAAGAGMSAVLPPVASDLVAVSVTRQAHLITSITYEVVEYRNNGEMRQGILVTWTARNGASLAGLLDRSMLPDTARQARRCYDQLGIDLTKLYADSAA